jgi:hypothetical protein
MDAKPFSASWIRSQRRGKLSISHVRTWHQMTAEARTTFDPALVLRYWRQAAWTPEQPPCIYRKRREQFQREKLAIRELLGQPWPGELPEARS